MRFSVLLALLLLPALAHAGQISSQLNDRCIEVSNANAADDAPVQMYTCYNFDHFRLDAIASGMGDYFQLRFRHSDKCVGVLAGSNDVGAAIVQESCEKGIDSQLWRLEDGKQLVVKHSGNCIVIPGMRAQNGVELQQWPCANAASNHWNLIDLEVMTESESLPLGESYLQLVSTASNRCAELPFGMAGDDLPLTQYTCYPQDHYQYSFVAMGEGYYHIQFRHSGKCVDVRGGSAANGTPIVQNLCADGVDSQLWRVEGPDRSQRLVNKAANKCFTLLNGSRAHGTPILLTTCDDATAGQTWRFNEVERKSIAEPLVDAYQQVIAQGDGRCLEVPAASKANDVPLSQFQCVDQDHFSFVFYAKGDYYQLMFKHSGKCASVRGGSALEGALIVQTDCEPEGLDDSQLWSVRGPSARQQLIVKSTGMCMHMSFGNLQGSRVQIVQSECSISTFWKFKSLEPIRRPDYLIGRLLRFRSKHSNRCIEMPNKSIFPGTGIAQYSCVQFDHFQLFVEPKGDYYHIIFKHSEQCLDVRGNSDADGVRLEQNPCDDQDEAQLWKIVGQPGEFQIINKLTDKCMDIEEGNKKNGAIIIQNTCLDSSSSMRWDLENYDRQNYIFAPSLSMNYYNIASLRSNRCLEMEGASVADNHPVVQYSCGNGDHYKLYFVLQGNAYHQIKFLHSDKCIGIRDRSEEEGAVVVQETCQDGADSQLFRARGPPGRQQLVAKHSGLCLNVNFGGNGAMLTQYRCLDSLSNYWDLRAQEPIPDAPLLPVMPGTSASRWEGRYLMPIIAVAAANLPDGRILTWSTTSRTSYSAPGDRSWTFVAFYDPTDNTSTDAFLEDTDHDMWCPGTSVLADGRIVITGGNNAEAVTIYDPTTDSWTRAPDMNIPRGYHSQTLTPEGHIFTLGGSYSGGEGGKHGELWDPSTPDWILKPNIRSEGDFLTNDNNGIYRSDNHMWLFTAPNGKIFHAGPSVQTHFLTMDGNGSATESIVRDVSDAMCGNAVMYDVGKLLVIGGAPSYDNAPAIDHAHVIDLNDGDNVTTKRVGDLLTRRGFPNSVALPSGEVVVVGGMQEVKTFKDTTAVMTAEIWSPVTETFTELSVMAVPRTYHSTAILMKDGRVWAGGGGQCGSCANNHLDAEILTPPYLFDAQGNLAIRPVIQSATPETRAGGIVSVTMDKATPHSFALVRLSAVTHSTNNDGRRFPLPVLLQDGTNFELKIHSNKAVALLGSYFLFAMNEDGVPSVATIIKIVL